MLVLTDEQKQRFHDEGYLLFPRLFRPEEIDKVDEAFQRLQKIAQRLERPELIDGSYYVVSDHRIDRIVWCGAAEPELLVLSADSRLTVPASQLLGSRDMDQLICQAHFKL